MNGHPTLATCRYVIVLSRQLAH